MIISDAKAPSGHDIKPLVTTCSEADVAYITLANPPVNALTLDLRRSLLSSLQLAQDDPAVKLICLCGQGAGFSAGLDVQELAGLPKDHCEAAPTLSDLCFAIEDSPKPVVAALHGTVADAGFALALAAHYRISGPKTRLGTPETSLGMVPGGGVTQRLPRIVGAKVALEMLLSGQPVIGRQAHQLGLVDQVVDMRNTKDMAEVCATLIKNAVSLPRSRDLTSGLSDGAAYMAEVHKRRSSLKLNSLISDRHIVDCVEAALLLPFEAGVFREETARIEMLGAPHVKAMRYAVFAERRAALPADFDPNQAQPIQALGIAGTSSMALEIALMALDGGLSVVIFGSDANQVALIQSKVARAYEKAAQLGQVTPAEQAARMGRFTGTDALQSLKNCDLVIEVSTGSVERRAQILSRIEEFVGRGTLLATISDHGFARMSQDLSHPGRFLGLHFFAPASTTRLVELARPDALSPQALASAHAVMRKLGKVPVSMPAHDGLIAKTLQSAVWAAVDVLLLLGLRPSQIDTALENYGMPLGPCAQMDAAGLMHFEGVVPTILTAEGRVGRGGSGGYYSYTLTQTGAVRGDDAAAVALIDPIREGAGLDRVYMSDAEICDRIVLAQANAGAKALQDGCALRPIDIDAVMLLATGFPPWRGGPMMAADEMQPLIAQKKLYQFAQEAPDIWEPAQIWAELIKNGDFLDRLNEF